VKTFSFTRFVRLLVRTLEAALIVAVAFRWFDVLYAERQPVPSFGRAIDIAESFSFLTVAVLLLSSLYLLATRQPHAARTVVCMLLYIAALVFTPYRLGGPVARAMQRPNQAMQLTAPRSVSPLRVATIFNLQLRALSGAVADLVSR
jgi:hypothetical protein